MALHLLKRLLTEPDKRLLWKFCYNFGWKGLGAVNRFKRRAATGDAFPAFVIVSVTNRCNLHCQGCWVTQTAPPQELSAAAIDAIVSECKARGSSFFGILGGEPLLYRGLFDVLGRHPDCYFQIFTNGTCLTDAVARELRRLGNVTPLISIEGREEVSDVRRGGSDVFGRAVEGLRRCKEQRLIAGVATSVCASNFHDLVSERFIADVARMGALYIWYYIYRPVGYAPTPSLALSREQIRQLRRFIVDIRLTAPVIVVDAYWDHKGRGLCPAATGISYHVCPTGHIEPCPPIQFACDRVGDGRSLATIFNNSDFLAGFRKLVIERTRGCILLEDPAALRAFVERSQAIDTTGRGAGLAELAAMTCLPSHDMPDDPIPERSRAYRFAKRHWFFGFGAYG
jgi:MoaA/NifB/PqqE/SkfB family radical SAM enzyme